MVKLFIKGIIIGLAKIIPGVSGAIFAMSFGVYDLIINSIADFKYALKNIRKLLPISVGIIVSIIIASSALSYILKSHYTFVLSFIIGVLFFEMYENIKKYRNEKINYKYLIASLITLVLISSLSFFKVIGKSGSETVFHLFVSIFLCGILDSIATIVPGISGSAILMLLGYYDTIITAFSKIKLSVMIPFSIGFIVGGILISNVVVIIFKKHENLMKYLISTFLVSSTISLVGSLFRLADSSKIGICIIILITGFIITGIGEKYLA